MDRDDWSYALVLLMILLIGVAGIAALTVQEIARIMAGCL